MDITEKKAIEFCDHLSALSGADCSLLQTDPSLLLSQKNENWYCNSCAQRLNKVCDNKKTLLYGCSEAYRWNGKYVFYCPQSLMFIASPLTDENGNMNGGMLVGPFVMGDIEDTLSNVDPMHQKGILKLPIWDTVKSRHVSEVLSAITMSISGVSHSLYGSVIFEQEKMLSELYRIKEEWQGKSVDCDFLIQNEKKLYSLIINKDKEGAQKLLNELLGYIYFTGEADFSSIKARVLELIIQLSRAAIEAGAEGQEVLIFNEGNIKGIEKINSIEELNVWVTGVIHRFILYSFDFDNVKYSDILYKTMQYVKANYQKKITLDDVASNVYLSRSYISRVFKEEMGETLFSYINRIRIEKSKTLLMNDALTLSDISNLCGFDDQSYFSKVFKSIVGITPKKYRDHRGRVN